MKIQILRHRLAKIGADHIEHYPPVGKHMGQKPGLVGLPVLNKKNAFGLHGQIPRLLIWGGDYSKLRAKIPIW